MTDSEKVLQGSLGRLYDEGGRIVVKEGWFWQTLNVLVTIVTLGTNRNFLTGYYTTLGPFVGVPKGWEKGGDIGRAAVIEHETVHVKQCKRLGLGSAYLGMPLFFILYLFVPAPTGFAWFRWRFEREAYAHGIRFQLQYGGWEGHREQLIDSTVMQLTSGMYAWTFPFKRYVRAYFEKVC